MCITCVLNRSKCWKMPQKRASISWRIIRLSERNLRLYQQVHCHGLFIILGHITRNSTIYQYVSFINLSFTTLYHRMSNGWNMFRSINNLELITIKKWKITGVEPRLSYPGHWPPSNVCRFVGSGKRRQSVSIILIKDLQMKLIICFDLSVHK